MSLTRDQAVEAVHGYFRAVDAGDVEAVLACFAPDAWLRCENADREFSGHDELRLYYARLAETTTGMRHEVQRVVVGAGAARAACELHYANTLKDGREYDMDNCNFFDFDADGRFTRVHFWLGKPL